MQEFCPECAKNGLESKVRDFQLNYEEAVFVCSNEMCTWPLVHQELIFITRQIGKEHSSDWEKVASKYIKTEQNGLNEFEPYMLPQTTAGLCDIMSIPAEDIIFLPGNEKIPSNFVKPSNLNADSAISSKMNSKPKVVSVQNLSNKSTSMNDKCIDKVVSVQNLSNKSISVNDKRTLIKTGKITLHPPVIKQVKIINRLKNIGHPYKKFHLNDISRKPSIVKMEEKDKKIKTIKPNAIKVEEKETNIKTMHPSIIKVEDNEIKTKTQDCLDEISTITDKYNSNFSSVTVDPIKDNVSDLDSEIDSFLNLTNISKDTEIELTNNDLDLTLAELWSSFSNEVDTTIKSELENSNDFKWLNNLQQAEFK